LAGRASRRPGWAAICSSFTAATGFLTFSFINITTGAPFPITGSGTPNQTLIRPYNPTLGIADGEKDIILQWSLY
jgi:hypothetical protein